MNTTGRTTKELPGPEVIHLDQQHFPQPWSVRQWEDLDPRSHCLYVFRLQNEVLGFALFGTVPEDNVAHLYKILILPEVRGQGVAKVLWRFAAQDIAAQHKLSVYLEVEANNVQAIRFYQKLGFLVLSRKKFFYSNGQDALILQLTL